MFPAPQTKVEEDEGTEKQEREQRRTGIQVVHAHAQKSWIFPCSIVLLGKLATCTHLNIRQVGDVDATQIWQAGVVLAEVRVERSLLATRVYQEWTSVLFSSWTRLRWSSLWTCASTWMRKRTR